MRIDVLEAEQGYPTGALARLAPLLASAMFEYGFSAYNNSRLSLREFEAGRIRTAEINGCIICKNYRAARDLKDYAAVSHMPVEGDLLKRGPEPDEAFYNNIVGWRQADIYSPRERIIIELAERIGLEPGGLPYDDAFWERARAELSDAEIADAVLCIGAWIAGGRVVHALGLDTVCGAIPMRLDSVA